jgi:hypothetical protein
MKSILFVAAAAATLCACATPAPPTAWGKPGVSMIDYRLDAGQCAVRAATATPENNGANTAGGINGAAPASIPKGSNTSAGSGGMAQGSGPSAPAGGGAISTSGGLYRDSADPDIVQRAATQQRTRDMAIQRARVTALKTCLIDRGYQEFQLTAEQRAHLATLPQGSDERRDYLYKLGTDPAVIKSQPAPR